MRKNEYRALGLRNPQINTPIPETQFQETFYSVQQHNADKAGPHVDLRIAFPQTSIAHSWAIPQNRMPQPGEKLLAVESGDHDIGYMSYQGTLTKGYGKGQVALQDLDKIEVLESDPNKITFAKYTGSGVERYTLVKITGKDWLILNTTATTKTRTDIPQFKRHYQDIKIDDIDLKNTSQYVAPKIDGAHVAIALRPDRRIDTFSYRPSKRGTSLIDHSFKSNLYKIKSPRSLGNTVLRGEIFGVDKKTGRTVGSTETAGLLNSSTWRSREEQKIRGVELQHMIFDIDKFKGKDVSELPYSEKLKLLSKINQEIPELKIIQPAKTVMDKSLLLESVKDGTNLLTREGVVVYDLNKSIPQRAKLRQDLDVYFHSPFVPKPGTRLETMDASGGFYASRQPGGEPTIRVGSGLSDEMRKDIAAHPEKYKNRMAKIYMQEEYSSGKVRMPILKEWRDYESWNKQASQIVPAVLTRDIKPVIKLAQVDLATTGNKIQMPSIQSVAMPADKTKVKTSSRKKIIKAIDRKDLQIADPKGFERVQSTHDMVDYLKIRDTRLQKAEQLKSLLSKKAGVIDPVQSTLDPELWSGDHLLPSVRLLILKCILDTLGPKTSLITAVNLIGASVTYQWTPQTDIDVNVGFDVSPQELEEFSILFKKSNPYRISGSDHVINLFATRNPHALPDDGLGLNMANSLGIYDVLNDKWLKRSDPHGQNVQWLVEQERPYINLFRHTLGRTVHALKRSIGRNESDEMIKHKAMEVVVLYKLLDNARKLQFSKGWGVPNMTPSNIDYKVIMKNPMAEKAEGLYHVLKKELYPEF